MSSSTFLYVAFDIRSCGSSSIVNTTFADMAGLRYQRLYPVYAHALRPPAHFHRVPVDS